MIRGLYTSALGMTVQMKKMDVTSNNIANADTTGFKKDIVVTQSFSDELLKRIKDPDGITVQPDYKTGNISQGVFISQVVTDFSSGTLRETGGKFDLAIDGTGFFTVSVTDSSGNTSEKYTRDGSFSLAADGTLKSKEGGVIMGQNGLIIVPDDMVTIGADGAVISGGEIIDYIKMTDFENPDTLRMFGDNLFDMTDETAPTAFKGQVYQGYIENSNVSSVREMVDMITLSRAYEANQKMVTIHDNILGRAVSDIGRK